MPHPAPAVPAEVSGIFPAVHDRIAAAVDELQHVPQLQTAVRSLVSEFQEESAMLAVPLLVHGALTGNRTAAVSVASMHRLWWVAAHVFDDVIDGSSLASELLSPGESVMAAVVCGSALPVRIAVVDFPPQLLPAMIGDYLDAWTQSNNGQIADLGGLDQIWDPAAVLITYLHKNGAAYGAACALASRLAGAPRHKVQLWRRFGATLGQLGQFRNDQEDLLSGRDEDLRNRTATYLITHLLDISAPDDRERLLAASREAHRCAEARRLLREEMLAPAALTGYLEKIDELRASAQRCLDELGVCGDDAEALRRLVDEAAQPVWQLDLPTAASA